MVVQIIISSIFKIPLKRGYQDGQIYKRFNFFHFGAHIRMAFKSLVIYFEINVNTAITT